LADAVPSQFDRVVTAGGHFYIGRIGHAAATDSMTSSFRGFVDAVRVYDRALSADEVKAHYEGERSNHRRMESGLDHIALTPYCYFEDGRILADVDFGSFYPFAESEGATLSLWRKKGESPVIEREITNLSESGTVRDVPLDIGTLSPGAYEVRAVVRGDGGIRAQASAAFSYPVETPIPAPKETMVPPLAVAPAPPAFSMDLSDGGGFRLEVGPHAYLVESTFSYPHGGENGLVVSRPTQSEPEWRVSVAEDGTGAHAQGRHYAIDRRIERCADRVVVKDTITNIGGTPVGIILSNELRAQDKAGLTPTRYPNPTVFLARDGQGIGMAALDDVYLEHHETFFSAGVAGIRDVRFALDAGASYTLEWAVYVNGTGDYYDFINALRRDEGLMREVKGSFAFIDLHEPPSEEFVRLRAMKYASLPCLSHAEDDPGISIEGIEFTEYPEECALVRQALAETRRRFPEMQVMFHIAHSLYATDRPDELFPDSRTMNAAGRQTDYGDNNVAYYRKYFSDAHVDEGYRWFIFYPAADNAFGKAMIEATDFMLDELGATGMFADGLTHGYGGRFTYDRWDGHTAEIDPETKTIVRLYASVNLVADPILIEVVRRINARGGVVIANSYPGTRTFHREQVLYCLETASGDETCSRLYLAPTVIGLGDQTAIASDRDLYDDIRGKLEWGALYFHYGEKNVTHPTLTEQMFPITVEGIHRGTIRGVERIVTLNAGVYGWPGDRDLHIAYRYDGRGVRGPHAYVTTVDAAGVRTGLALGAHESGVVRRIPITLEARQTVNLCVRRYDADGIDLVLNGHGTVRFDVRDGEFGVTESAGYTATVGGKTQVVSAKAGGLAISFKIKGATELAIRRAS